MSEAKVEAKLIERKHPEYLAQAPIWEFLLDSYNGGEAFVKSNLFRYYKEGDEEYKGRQDRAYRENHTKRVVDLFNSYLFKEPATRKNENELVNDWIDNVDGKGTGINKFMKQVSLYADILGRVYVVMDKKPLPEEDRTGTHADDLKTLPYMYVLFPQDIMDLAFDEEGRIKWVLVRESKRDDDDPFTSTGDVTAQYRLWQKGSWKLYDAKGALIDEGETGLNVVPIIPFDNQETDSEYVSKSLVEDVAYIDRAIYNNWSRLDVIINDQTFSQLIIPVEAMVLQEDDESEDGEESLKEQFLTMGTKRIFLYSATASQPPQFISPDASQAQLILETIQIQTKQLYASMGLAGETATEVKAQSGTAKAYDFDKLNKMLATKADNLEQLENYLFDLFGKWMGQDNIEVEVDYPDEFDVKTLMDELAEAQELFLIDVSKTFNKELKKNIAAKAMPKLDSKKMQVIIDEIEEQEEEPENGEAVFDFDKTQKTNTQTEDVEGEDEEDEKAA